MNLLILSSCVLLLLRESVSQGLNYTANQKYSYVGKMVVDIASQKQISGPSNWSTPVSITIPYPVNLKYNNNTNLTGLAVFGDFQYKGFTNRINIITMMSQKTQTYIVVNIYSGLANYIQKLSIVYILVLRESYYKDFAFYLIQQTNNDVSYNFANTSLPSTFTIFCTMPEVNFTGGATSVAFISGLNVELAYYPGTLQLLLQTEIKSSTLLLIKISSPSRSAQYVYIDQYCCIQQGLCFHTPLSLSLQCGLWLSIIFKLKLNLMAPLNTFVGLTGFKISNQNTFSFFSSVDSPSISITSKNYFDYITFSFLVVTSNYCDYRIPYYQQVNKICYSSCPGTFIPDNTTLSCVCFANNLKVNNSNCILKSIQYAQQQKTSISLSALIGISIGSFFGILLLIVIIIYIKRRKNLNKDSNKDKAGEKPRFENKIKIIDFKKNQPQSFNSRNVINDLIRKQSEKDIVIEEIVEELPSYHRQKGSYLNSVWRDAQLPNQPQELCSICLERRTFFRSSCSHNFHLACVSRLDKNQKKCPYCRKRIENQGRFYCSICNRKYRIEELNGNNPQQSSMQIQCDECKNIPI